MYHNAKRTICHEPKLFPLHKNNYVTYARNYWLARDVWSEIASASGQAYSSDYAQGFKCGFADYLYAGGTGEPPPLPPRQYWNVGFETVEGKQAIENWFAGFRHGASACRDGGYREMATVPSSLSTTGDMIGTTTDELQPVFQQLMPEEIPSPVEHSQRKLRLRRTGQGRTNSRIANIQFSEH